MSGSRKPGILCARRLNKPARPRRKAVFLLAAAAACALLAAPRAEAQTATYCVNCNTLSQSLVAFGKQLVQVQNEIQTAANTLNTYQTLVQNTISLPFNIYRDASGIVTGMQNLGNSASLTGGATGTMLGNLSVSTGYPLAAISNVAQQFINEDVALASALRTAGTVLRLQTGVVAPQSASITSAAALSGSASGTTQAIEAGNQIAAANAQQSAAAQTALTTGMQAQLTATTVAADREAIYLAAQQRFATYVPLPANGYQGF